MHVAYALGILHDIRFLVCNFAFEDCLGWCNSFWVELSAELRDYDA